ncbi:MAG: hypothetical protein OEV87_00605 [Phycisphaerae bacterium]|nr:hypothetical protein [Phycisphaerae bacterium]
MASQYQPKDHIQRLDIAPRPEGVFDQREITIQSYQTTVPFDYAQFDAAIESAWLKPQIRFGVFSRTPVVDNSERSIDVVLGLQDELSVRAYDYDNRRPIYYSWQDLVVDTVSIHYFCDEDGLLRFTTTGGGRKITDDRLYDFNASFLEIPKDAVSKRHFDLDKLRELCFGRFCDRLHMIKVTDPSDEGYRSIDHAQFQSREYFDPKADRLNELKNDPTVKVESFDSDIEVHADILAQSIRVRFFIRGSSGSLRLRLPKIHYKHEYKSVDEQTHAFYKLVDTAVNCILDADYYSQQKRSLEDLSSELQVLSPDLVDLAPFRDVLVSENERQKFFDGLKLDRWEQWQPHMRVLNELISSEVIKNHIEGLLNRLVTTEPLKAANLLVECCNGALLNDIGTILAHSCADKLQGIDEKHRSYLEEAILAWAVSHEQDAWDVVLDRNEIEVFSIHWKTDDLSTDVLAKILWKLIGVFHDRLLNSQGNTHGLLSKLHQCVGWVKSLPKNLNELNSALKLIVAEKVPAKPSAGKYLTDIATANIAEFDNAVLNTLGLPLWPMIEACSTGKKLMLTNTGLGDAINVSISEEGLLFNDKMLPLDLVAGESIENIKETTNKRITLVFEKYAQKFCVDVPITECSAEVDSADVAPDYDWAKQAEIVRATIQVLGEEDAPDKATVSRWGRDGKVKTNGETGHESRIDVNSFLTYIAKEMELENCERTQIRNAIIGEINARKN